RAGCADFGENVRARRYGLSRPFAWMLVIPLALFAFSGLPLAHAAVQQAAQSTPPALAAVAIVRQRLVQSLLPTDRAAIDSLNDLAGRDAASLSGDGHWAGIDYASQERSDWTAA